LKKEPISFEFSERMDSNLLGNDADVLLRLFTLGTCSEHLLIFDSAHPHALNTVVQIFLHQLSADLLHARIFGDASLDNILEEGSVQGQHVSPCTLPADVISTSHVMSHAFIGSGGMRCVPDCLFMGQN
jgi:hypothetical protein